MRMNYRSSALRCAGVTTGLTAYAGIVRVGEVQANDVVVVSAAAGAVGSVRVRSPKIAVLE